MMLLLALLFILDAIKGYTLSNYAAYFRSIDDSAGKENFFDRQWRDRFNLHEVFPIVVTIVIDKEYHCPIQLYRTIKSR